MSKQQVEDFVKRHWRKAVLTAAVLAASYYGGQSAGEKVNELLPALCAAVGVC